MSLRRHSNAGLRAKRSALPPEGTKLGTNEPNGGDFSEWTVPNAAVKPSYGNIQDSRLYLNDDISELFGLDPGSYYAASLETPKMDGGVNRIAVAQFETDSGGGLSNDFPIFAIQFSDVRASDLTGEATVLASVGYHAYVSQNNKMIAQWYTADGTTVTDQHVFTSNLDSNSSYWLSLRINANSVVCSLWGHDPGHRLTNGSPMATLTLDSQSGYSTLYNHDLWAAAVFVNTAEIASPMSGLQWYQPST